MTLAALASDPVTVSVIICTHDRSEDVRVNLPSVVASCQASSLTCEIIVVDNAPSDDRTREIVRGQPCSYLLEPKSGVSYARNAGADAARGEILLCADDDVEVPLNWVDELTRPIREGRCDLVAGQIVPGPGRDLPWMGPQLRSSLLLTPDDGEPSHLIGATYACKASILDQIRFDPDLGGGSRCGSAEDVLFYEQATSAGFLTLGCSKAPVRHHFNLARMTYDSLASKAEAVGRSDAYVMHHWLHSRLRFLRLRLAVAFVAARWASARPADGVGMSDSEFRARVSYACKRQLVRERRLPRNYGYRGLRRRTSPQPTVVIV